MTWTPEGLENAGRSWREGLGKLPNSSLLRVKLGWHHYLRAYMGWGDDPAADFRRAGGLVREVFRDPGLSPMARRLGHWLFAYVASQERDLDRALSEANAAIALAPCDMFLLGDIAGSRAVRARRDGSLAVRLYPSLP